MVPQSRELIEDRSHYWLPSAHWKYHWGDDKCKLKTSNNSHSLLVLINLVGKWWWQWRKFTNRGHCEKTEHEEEEEVEEWGDGKLSDRLRVHLGFFKKSIKPELVMTKHRNTWKTRPSPCVMTSSIATPLCWRKWLQLYRAVWPKGLKGPVILIKWGPVRTTRNWAPKQERGHNIW